MMGIIILLFGLFGIKALFHPGFFTSHDGWHQLTRLYHFHTALMDGQFPPRWAGEAFNGYGYPLFSFTYQLPFYGSEIFHQLGFSLWDAVKITFILAYLLSGLTMYLFAKTLWGRWGGLLSAILYLWAPYRFSTIFVRGALGEHVAYLFLPLFFLGAQKCACKSPRTGTLLLAISTAGLILSHALTAQLILPAATIFFIFLLFWTDKKRIFLFSITIGALLGLGLSSYYLFPALEARRWIVGFNPLHFSEHFPTFGQLLYSPWGYGFSFGGTRDDGMSFQLGVPHWITIGLSTILLVSRLLRRNLRTIDWITLTFLSIVALNIFLMLDFSSPLWASTRHIITIDFPWRLLGVTTFAAAALGGYLLQAIRPRFLAVPLFLFFATLTLYANRNHTRVNMYERNPKQFIIPSGTSTSYDEYAPIWAAIPLARTKPEERIEVTHGRGTISSQRKTSNMLSFQIESAGPVRVHINQFYFPPWEASIDGEVIPDTYTDDGTWKIDVPTGKHTVELHLRETTIGKVSNTATIASLSVLFGIWRLRRKRQTSLL